MIIGTVKTKPYGRKINLCLNLHYGMTHWVLSFRHRAHGFQRNFFKEFPMWRASESHAWYTKERRFYLILTEEFMKRYIEMLKSYNSTLFEIGIKHTFDEAVQTMVESKL